MQKLITVQMSTVASHRALVRIPAIALPVEKRDFANVEILALAQFDKATPDIAENMRAVSYWISGGVAIIQCELRSAKRSAARCAALAAYVATLGIEKESRDLSFLNRSKES